METVFSIEGTPYQRWQAELLAYTHARAGQPGPLTCIQSGGAREPLLETAPGVRGARTFFTENHNPHPVTRDDYAPYNKPYALLDWLEKGGSVTGERTETTILLVDPDCVFLRPLGLEVSRGHPLGNPIVYMDPARFPAALAGHCSTPSRLDPVGIPIAIHRDDLAALLPRWIEKTVAIRSDARAREAAGWIAEMWAYCMAAAELGLAHEHRQMAQFQHDLRDDLPMVHYCYSSEDPATGWRWDKKTYKPWERVEVPLGAPPASRAMLPLLNELADLRRAATAAARSP